MKFKNNRLWLIELGMGENGEIEQYVFNEREDMIEELGSIVIGYDIEAITVSEVFVPPDEEVQRQPVSWEELAPDLASFEY